MCVVTVLTISLFTSRTTQDGSLICGKQNYIFLPYREYTVIFLDKNILPHRGGILP